MNLILYHDSIGRDVQVVLPSSCTAASGWRLTSGPFVRSPLVLRSDTQSFGS